MRLLIKAVLILVFCIPVITQAKNNLEKRKTEFFLQIDSLKLNPDQLKLDYKSRNYYQDSVSIYYQEILEMYKHIHSSLNHSQQIYWLYEIGLLERCLGHMDQAILSHQSIGQLIDKNEDERSYFFNNIQLADVYRQSGRKKESNDVFLLLLELPMIQKDTSQQMDINSMVSENYENLGEHAKALELALQLYNYHLKESEYAAASYNLIQMGRISSVIESDTSYLEYYHMANDLALRSGDIGRIINNLINTGIIYRNNSYPLIGLKYLKKAENYKDPEFDHANTYLFHALSRTYNALDSFALGYVYSLKELKEAEAYDDYPSMFYAQLRLLDHYVRNDEVEQARNALREAVRLNKVIDNKSLYPSLYKQLSDMSLRMKDYPKAMAYLDSSYLAQDKFLSKTNNDKLVDLREKSDYYIHRNRISELVTKNKLEQEKSARLKITIFAFLFVLALTVYFTIVIRKRLHELKESYVNLVKKSLEQDKLNKQLRACEVKHKKKHKLDHISGEDLIIKNFKKLLYKDEIYTNTNISLKSLADDLDTNTTYLSAIINSHFNCNLRSLINKHRIEKAREMLVSKEFNHYSMEGISTEVGFSSRSGFYQAFKASTGLSPSLYIENYNLLIASN